MPSSRQAKARKLGALYIAGVVERKALGATIIVHKKANKPMRKQVKKEEKIVTEERLDFSALMIEGMLVLKKQVEEKMKAIEDEARAKGKTLDEKLQEIGTEAKRKLGEQDEIINDKLRGFTDNLAIAKKETNDRLDALIEDMKRVEAALNTLSRSISRRVSVAETELGITAPPPTDPKASEQPITLEDQSTPTKPVGKLATIEQQITELTKQVSKLADCISAIGDLCCQKKEE